MEFLWAFIIGGLFCAVGQVLIDYTKLTPARILVAFVVIGVVLSALNLYQPIIDFAGAGASVPLTGFGHILADGVRKAIDKDGFLGIFTGGLTSAAGGITAALIFGLCISLIFQPKDK
ncbi:MAG: stage V sporulation protein AE [Clostridiales bacterium]|jgi:stage V sporulation protein AE|nr:stage V sporulation protein AE [Clostridiales bacterium]